LPLTFITGFYGMNGIDLTNFFSLPSGLIMVLVIMGIILAVLIIFFRKKQGYLRENIMILKKI
jgi:magnesium transporter